MANTTIQLKHSTLTGNVPSSLANGEISINSRDGKFFYSTPASVIITHYPYLGPAGLNKEIQFNDSGTLGSNAGLAFDKTSGSLNVSNAIIVGGRNLDVYANAAFLQANTPSYVANSAATYANGAFTKANNAFANTTGTFNGSLSVTGTFASLQSTGDEGGQIDLATSATNQSLVGGLVSIDIFQNKLRIFEAGGTNRGVYIDIANGASAGVGTNLLAPSNSTDGWARGQANASFAAANSTASYANSAFAQANSASGAAAASSYANSAFSKANSACTAAASAQSTASSAAGAAASAQSTADSAYNTYDIASIYTPNNSTSVSATGRSDTVNLVGTAGIYIFSNTATKTITVAGGIQSLPGAQGMTVDYGYVSEAVYYAIDYGTL
jgi:hypothetical protein